MSDTAAMLEAVVDRYFADGCSHAVLESADAGNWPQALWEGARRLGFDDPLSGAAFGATGEGLTAEYAVLTAAARHAAPLPLAEAMLARLLLAEANFHVPSGLVLLAFGDELTLGPECLLSGTAQRVPWGRQADHLVVITREGSALVPRQRVRIEPGLNLANEPRDRLHFDSVPPVGVLRLPQLSRVRERAALMRATQLAAAAERVLALAVDYATTRRQFGRPIGAFQAVQHQLAIAAGQAAAAKMAVLAAYREMELSGVGEQAALAAAIAKSRSGEAAAAVAAIAHQVHGAMGFTYEHPLHFYTRRIQAWRSEYGSEAHWERYIGRRLLQAGADRLWPSMT